MQFSARYYDGLTADPRHVFCRVQGTESSGFLEVTDLKLDHRIAQWRLDGLFPVHAKKGMLSLGSEHAEPGARIVLWGPDDVREAKRALPMLARHRQRQRGRQAKLIGLASLAMASVVLSYVYGIPLVSSQIAAIVPAELEEEIGGKIAVQMAMALDEQGGLTLCDPDPDSLANQAIQRFARVATQGTNTPFEVNIQVVANAIPNAFALPGGQAFYFKGLLDETQSADEFAGVMSHEIGHVVHRDGMQQLIATAGTGLLVGFIAGDVTGLSIAAALGAAVINSNFSRDAERDADRFAIEVAQRQYFRPAALTDLLGRISVDDADAQVFALLSTHPLTQERAEAMRNAPNIEPTASPAFSEEEWQAIKSMCGAPRGEKTKNKTEKR